MLIKIFCGILILLLSINSKVEAAEVGVDWNNLIVTAKGAGMTSGVFKGTQSQKMARAAAINAAKNQLKKIINGIKINAETSVEKIISTSKLDEIIHSAKIIDEHETERGSYEVTLQIPMSAIAEVVLERPKKILPIPEPSTSAEVSNYTGLIIDCRGLNLIPVMTPVIKNSDGTKLYSYENLNCGLVISKGIVSYAENFSQATRAGKNPLVIKAESLADNNSNPVIGIDNGNKILLENGATNFLGRMAVIFLR